MRTAAVGTLNSVLPTLTGSAPARPLERRPQVGHSR